MTAVEARVDMPQIMAQPIMMQSSKVKFLRMHARSQATRARLEVGSTNQKCLLTAM